MSPVVHARTRAEFEDEGGKEKPRQPETPVGRPRRLTAPEGVLAFHLRGGSRAGLSFSHSLSLTVSGGDEPMKLATQVSVGDLENEHRLLDRRIKKLNHRANHMTPLEQVTVTQLKKLRLATKDRLASIGRR